MGGGGVAAVVAGDEGLGFVCDDEDDNILERERESVG